MVRQADRTWDDGQKQTLRLAPHDAHHVQRHADEGQAREELITGDKNRDHAGTRSCLAAGRVALIFWRKALRCCLSEATAVPHSTLPCSLMRDASLLSA